MRHSRALVRGVGSLMAALAVMATGCGIVLGIEDLAAEGGVNGTGGSGGVDASGDRGVVGGGGAGASGDSGRDVNGTDQGADVTVPQGDAVADNRGDISSVDVRTDTVDDSRVPDSGDARVEGGPLDALVPDVGMADVANDVMMDAKGPEAGAPDVGTADAPIIDAPPDQPPTITVSGHVIDYWLHDVPNTPVTIGAATATTDATGHFTISGIAPPYDLALTISVVKNNTQAKYGWLYKGLTRPDPTLQVERGVAAHSTNTLTVNVANIDFANLPGNEGLHAALGGVDGAISYDITAAATDHLSSLWYGPATTSMTGHALHWVRAGTSTGDLPTSYLSYEAQPVTLVDSGNSTISFDLANRAVSSGSITGTITPSSAGGQRSNEVFVQYADHAVTQIASESAQLTSFSYLVPSVAGATATIAAMQGGTVSSPPYAVAHKDNLVAGQTGVSLAIPDYPSISTPVCGATGVNQSTPFRWSGSAKVLIWTLEFVNEYKAIYVVTADKQGLIPTMPDGPAIAAGTPLTWWVDASGTYQSVDEAAGPDGVLDSFYWGEPDGARRVDGTFARSEKCSITTGP